MTDPGQVRALALDGDSETARACLEAALRTEPREGAARLAWSRLAQEIGATDLALAELEAGLREAPGDAELVEELRSLRGDLQRPAPDRLEESPGSSVAPTDAALVRFLHRFSGREDTHARQWMGALDERRRERRGGYSPVAGPITPELLRAHLSGRMTLGTYLIRLDGTVTSFVIDLDLTRRALDAVASDGARAEEARRLVHQEGLRLHRALNYLGLPTLLEDSGYKGRHLWGLLAEPLPADLVHRFGRALLHALSGGPPETSLELFPKQDRVRQGGLGNLVKLPLGVHLRSGRRSVFLDSSEGRPVADPWGLVGAAERISRDGLLTAMAVLRDRIGGATAPEVASPPPESGQLERVRSGCAVIAELMRKAADERRLTHDEQVVLSHSLGHLDSGVEALQRLFERCPEVPPHALPQRARSGHPISCARIRARIPATTARLPCHCELPGSEGHYPSPVLHALPKGR